MPQRKRLILVVPAWTGLVSAIALQRLFAAPALTAVDWSLIFASSIFAGMVAGELENAVLGFAVTLLMSSVVIGFVLALPATLGLTGPLFETVVQQSALSEVVQTLFPFTIVLIISGGVLGSAVAEKFELN